MTWASAFTAFIKALYVSTKPLTEDFRVALLAATVIVLAVGSVAPVALGETPASLIVTPLMASEILLDLETIC
ncbi:hypothetical protein D3C85_1844480 [compost metagenome]